MCVFPTSLVGTNFEALDILLVVLLLDEETHVPKELKEELELELKLEPEPLLAVLTRAFVGVRRARLENGASFFAASWPRHPDQKHLTTAARSSSPTTNYGNSGMCCARHRCATTRCMTSKDMQKAHSCTSSISSPSMLYQCMSTLCDTTRCKIVRDLSLLHPTISTHTSNAHMPTNCMRWWHTGKQHTTLVRKHSSTTQWYGRITSYEREQQEWPVDVVRPKGDMIASQPHQP